MKIGSNKNINKAEVYRQKSCLPAALSKFGKPQGAADK